MMVDTSTKSASTQKKTLPQRIMKPMPQVDASQSVMEISDTQAMNNNFIRAT